MDDQNKQLELEIRDLLNQVLVKLQSVEKPEIDKRLDEFARNPFDPNYKEKS